MTSLYCAYNFGYNCTSSIYHACMCIYYYKLLPKSLINILQQYIIIQNKNNINLINEGNNNSWISSIICILVMIII